MGGVKVAGRSGVSARGSKTKMQKEIQGERGRKHSSDYKGKRRNVKDLLEHLIASCPSKGACFEIIRTIGPNG